MTIQESSPEINMNGSTNPGLASVIKPIAWMVLGGAIIVAIAFVAGVLPPHNDHVVATDVADTEFWTCGMHPEVIEEEPGTCPICHMNLTPLNSNPPQAEHGEAAKELWACPMHPEVLETEPGACPICKMDLVPVELQGLDTEGSNHHGTVVTIDPVVVQNMNVRTQPGHRRDLSRSIRTVGHLDYDQERMVSVTTRYAGFIEKVFVNHVGQPVAKGEPLFEVYSPELVQTQQELLSAVEYARRMSAADPDTQRRANSLVSSARQRLSYWDVTADQVTEIETSGRVLRTLTVVSPLTGVVMQRMHGLEGMAIRPGMEALHVADLSSLWLTVEIYEDQLPWLGEDSTANVSFDYLPGEQFSGRVRYVEPEVSPSTRTVKLTLQVPNRDRRLRVGMYATVVFKPVVARNAVVIPAQAVIRSGERDIVVVALGGGRFAPREVTLGVQSDGLIQVIEGLDGTEEIVTSAQFLIDSESNLRAAVEKMISAKRGHQH
ncbi:MAG: efflux RND transporter periplasmic adaptor subunit [bacterium]|nr:efflux RND transporter periplasmic adaptor subunit [bacterium]